CPARRRTSWPSALAATTTALCSTATSRASWYKAATPSVPAMQGLHLGTKFADEFRESQGANSRPNANGSRFFITYAKQPITHTLRTTQKLNIFAHISVSPADAPRGG
ncbi:hypothetical protein ACJX0J_006178, partial [Zea mays]